MSTYELDDVDRQLLNLLQADARHSAIELAEQIGVSDNTVHNRMDRLEEAGVVTGYTTNVDLDRAGLRLYFHFTCTASISDRSAVADEALELPQILEVTELMTGQENLQIKAVGVQDDDITYIAEQLDDLALAINDENLIREEHTSPIDFVELGEMIEAEE